MEQKIKKFTIQQNIHQNKRPNLFGRLFRFFVSFFSRSKKHGTTTYNNNNRSKFKKILTYLPTIIIALILAGLIGTLVVYAWVRQELPDPNKLTDRAIAQTTKIYDRTGEILLYEVHGVEKRTIVALDDISLNVRNATIVAEDRDFYSHKGFKVTGYARAFFKNLVSGDRLQGGSTITQQLVKNALLTPEKTYTRKLKELLLSIEIERSFNKDDILKMYLNEIPYGS
ncbi:transglycosylase domain-containing protein, partial [Patescibacteria group bacterium]|nr:transglycosylase domain-containing protein [Patescibacteria group bacterium]